MLMGTQEEAGGDGLSARQGGIRQASLGRLPSSEDTQGSSRPEAGRQAALAPAIRNPDLPRFSM